MAIIGIDLGTTNSLVSVYKEGRVQLIPNSFGEYLTPSVVSFGEDGEVFVGKIAKEMLITRPNNTFCEFKRNMGTDYLYYSGNKSYRAEELSAFVLRRLKEDAENFLGETVTEAIISVPAYFNDEKRCATKMAGKIAGLHVERLINEPSAVALKHHSEQSQMEDFIVFDFGGGTLDVSLVEAFENMVEICAVAGDNYLGGKDFNEIIVEDFCNKNQVCKESIRLEDKGILLKEAELLKIALSEKNEATRTFFFEEKEYTMSLSNQELIHISVELFQRMKKPIEKVLSDAGRAITQIDKIILVGGSSQMPIVKQYIKSLTSVPVIVDDQPNESIALGVGMAAAIKERTGEIKDMILADICPFTLGVKVYDGTISPVIERNDTLPCSRTQYFVTVRDFQRDLKIEIYQGENMMAKDNLLLGELELHNLPMAPRGQVGAEVTFTYDINGILDVQVKGDDQCVHKVIYNKKAGISEEEAERRIEELKKQTLHPMEDEEIRLLVEWALRIFEESDAETRQRVTSLLKQYKAILNKESALKIRQATVHFAFLLQALEQRKVSLGEFSEDFFSEEEMEES